MAVTTQVDLKQEINEGILRNLLGVNDINDIDFETYRVLLREKIAVARLGGSDMDSGDIDTLTKEFLRVRKISSEVREDKKIDVKKLLQKVESKKVSNKKNLINSANIRSNTSQSVNPMVMMVPTKEEPETEEPNFKEQVSKGLENIVPSIDNLQSTMESILGTLKKQALLDRKEEREEDALEAKERRVKREKLLESKGKKEKKIDKKTIKPVKGIFDFLLDFFKNVLLGGGLLLLLKILKDPQKILQPIVDALNNVLSFFNGIISGINGFIDGFNKFVFGPINDFILKPIHSSLNFIEDRINDVLGLFGADPLENIPNESPALELPNVPEIPLYDPFKIRPENQEQAQPIQQTYQGGQVINNNYTTNQYSEGGSVNYNTTNNKGNSVESNTFNTITNKGGNVTNNSGVNIKGAGPDTQLIAAQPGEIVMSRGAVSKFGADNLLAMNAAGGGNNTPRMTNNIQMNNGGGTVINAQGFSGGGLVGGTAGTPSDPKNRKVFFHWTGGFHNQNVGPYHQVFDGSGNPMRTSSYGIDNSEGTGGYNTNSVAIAAAAMGHSGMTASYYDDAKGWSENPLTGAQTTAMAKEAAGLLKSYGQTVSDVDKNVMTHGEAERKGVRSGKLGGGVQRWDLDSLNPGPYKHPGGFFSTQQVKSAGGNTMRSKIKQFMGSSPSKDTSSDADLMSTSTTNVNLEGVSNSNFNVFESLTEGQKSRILAAPVGSNVEGVNVTNALQQELRTYETTKIIGTGSTKLPDVSIVKSPAETSGTPAPVSAPKIKSSAAPVTPGPRVAPTVKTTVIGGGGNSINPNAVPTSSAAGGGIQNTVPTFSSVDSMNNEMLIIKSIYNIIG